LLRPAAKGPQSIAFFYGRANGFQSRSDQSDVPRHADGMSTSSITLTIKFKTSVMAQAGEPARQHRALLASAAGFGHLAQPAVPPSPREGGAGMNGGPSGQIYGQRHHRSLVRPAVVITAIGSCLTIGTVVTALLNLITSPQAVAMALTAGLTTMIGVIGFVVPNAWIAWRRGFREGCRIAMESQQLEPPEEGAGHWAPGESAEPGIVSIFARSAARQMPTGQR
jgi:hypothetical protein